MKEKKQTPLEDVQKQKILTKIFNQVVENPIQFETFVDELEGYVVLEKNRQFAEKLVALIFTIFLIASGLLFVAVVTSETGAINIEIPTFYFSTLAIMLVSFANYIKKQQVSSKKWSAIFSRLQETSLDISDYGNRLVDLSIVSRTIVDGYNEGTTDSEDYEGELNDEQPESITLANLQSEALSSSLQHR